MYTNIGRKIMILAKIAAWLIIIGGIVTGIIFMSFGYEMVYVGLGTIVASPIAAYLSTVLLYGFGKLVDSTEKIEKKMYGSGEIKSETQIKADNKRIDKLEELRSMGLITEEEYKKAVSNSN